MRAFNAEQVAVGGVALWVSHDGSLGKSFYRAKAEAKPKASSGEPQPLYSNSLFADLTRIKTQIVQEAVAADPALALDIMLDSLAGQLLRSEEHTSELQSLMRISYAVFCLKKKTNNIAQNPKTNR